MLGIWSPHNLDLQFHSILVSISGIIWTGQVSMPHRSLSLIRCCLYNSLSRKVPLGLRCKKSQANSLLTGYFALWKLVWLGHVTILSCLWRSLILLLIAIMLLRTSSVLNLSVGAGLGRMLLHITCALGYWSVIRTSRRQMSYTVSSQSIPSFLGTQSVST